MARNDRILAVDIGSTGVRMGEFDTSDESFVLHAFKTIEYSESLTEANRTLVIASAVRRGYEEGGFTTNRTSVCVSGQAAFMRFVKLPPVAEEEARIKQIVEYEAKQNVPFPMDEVIWDYQLFTAGTEDEDLEVMFVVIKNDIVEGVIEAVSEVGLKPQFVDFAPAALYNVARANHVGENECAMVLNIGGRCTTLLFLDGVRFFARTIPVAGFAITQQIAKEFGINNEEAEILKRRHGFVALGGAYEEPESEVAATISKIVRNVMTRQHGEINRSISVYRTQQKGRKPSHLYLAGGSSTMAFTDHFFSEKLRMEVSYLNPFKIVSLDETLDVQQLQDAAHMFPEVVGVGLRQAIECPVEVSLVPESLRRRQAFSAKQPYIILACVVWLITLSVFIGVNTRTVQLFQKTEMEKKNEVNRLSGLKSKIRAHQNTENDFRAKHEELRGLLDSRYRWSEFFNYLQLAKPQDVWLTSIESMSSPQSQSSDDEEEEESAGAGGGMGAVDIFGGFGGGGGGGAKQESQEKAEEGEILWFKLVGQCVKIKGEEPLRPLFPQDQLRKIYGARIAELEAAIAAAEADEAADEADEDADEAEDKAEGDEAEADEVVAKDEGAEEEEEEEEEKEEKEEKEEEDEEEGPDPREQLAKLLADLDAMNRVTEDTRLPHVFNSALRASPYFDESKDTKILKFAFDEQYVNLQDFEIQLKLKKAIDTRR
jgi:type IV pilus assembly protein PilM